jgi:serine protease Do
MLSIFRIPGEDSVLSTKFTSKGDEMMIVHRFLLLLLASLVLVSGCTARSSRRTPIVRVVKEYAPMVVNIRTERILDLRRHPEWGRYGEELDALLKEYYGEAYADGTLRYKSLGSGVILNKNGIVVTNAHVIQKASNIFVILNDGTILQATVVGLSQNDDLAFIRVSLPHSAKEVRFADTSDLMIGETVVAIGNPLGLRNSVTVGVLSGKDRAFSSQLCQYVCSGLLQTDASINPGNSGGALLNLDGELIGLNLAVVQNAQNIGFAIPVDKIVRLLKEFE